ncbi:MAG: 50S ribosomal protein L23 [Desulfobacteraceae bacterium]
MKEFDILKKPVVTEKSTLQKELENKITLEVDKRANRVQIKEAVERSFNTRVDSVRTMQVKGKKKQRGRIAGKRKDWKKAIVKLAPGQKIDFFEGV